MKYEMVAGFETHVELSTKTKIFCGCTTQFGGDPNTHCCPICIGLPGTLPKLNRQVVRYAVMAGLQQTALFLKLQRWTERTIAILTSQRLIRFHSLICHCA